MTVRQMARTEMWAAGVFGNSRVSWNENTNEVTAQRPGAINRQNQPQTAENIRTAGADISRAVSQLTTQGANAFQGATSDAAVATVTTNAARTIAAVPPQDTSVEVRQLAAAQVNEGGALTAGVRTFDEGLHSFTIETGGNTHSFQVEVAADDTNEDVLRNMATAINEADTGITATISIGEELGARTAALTLTGQTGAANTFEVNDASGSLAGISQMGVLSQAAADAEFRLNDGAWRTSDTNNVNIAAGVDITLTGVGEADITFGRTAEQSVAAVRDLVSSINSALNSVNPNDGRGSQRFVSDIMGMNFSFESTLARIGIGVTANGRLTINESALQTAAQSGAVDRVFEDRGFASRAETIARNAAGTRQYANAPQPVNMNNNMFDFANAGPSWNIMNMFM